NLEQLGININDGLDRLKTADSSLMKVNDVLQRIRTLTISGLNSPTGPQGREAIAKEIDELRQDLVQQANIGYAGQPLFGGTTPNESAFNPDTGEFIGNINAVTRVISNAPGAAGQLNVGINGEEIFGTDLVASTGALAALAQAIRTGDADAMRTGLGDVDALRERVLDGQTTIGAKINRLDRQVEINGRQHDATTIALSKVEDTDFMKAAMDLAVQSTSYQAALSASAKVIQPSLVDFIR
ncbi:MAG: flagellin, partial [Propionibacteriaceae bacterium]|nr:flagellin [Propionibacteriaceae bacterium]